VELMRDKKKAIQRINEMKSWIFEKINKINKLRGKPTKMRGKRPKLIKLEMKIGK
jgi:hypothetical protein